jgi:hypothetical protein
MAGAGGDLSRATTPAVSHASQLKLTGGDCDLFASAFVQLLAASGAEQGPQQLDQRKTHRQVPNNKAASAAALKG